MLACFLDYNKKAAQSEDVALRADSEKKVIK